MSVSVEEVTRGKALVRFTELPRVLHGDDPRFAPPIQAWERFRQSRYRNPYLQEAEVARFLARVDGRPVGRVAAHVHPDAPAEGRIGFWCCTDDQDVADALLAHAAWWLVQQGAASITGPVSFGPDEEPGLLVEGHDVPGTTGRPWQPAYEAELLEVALDGATPADAPSWRLRTTETPSVLPEGGAAPGQAGSYLDPRLVLEGIAAVPDVAGPLRTSGLRSAWSLARQAKERAWEGCTVVRCDGDPAVVVPALLGTAGRAGYSWVVAPWSPDPAAAPETVHRRWTRSLDGFVRQAEDRGY